MNNDFLINLLKKSLNVSLSIASRLDSPPKFIGFVRELGWDFPQDRVPDFNELIGDHLPALEDAIAVLDESESDEDRLTNLLLVFAAFIQVLDDIKDIGSKFSSAGTWPDTIDKDEFIRVFPKQLLDYFLFEFIKKSNGSVYAFMRMIGVIRMEAVDQAGKRLAHVNRIVEFSKLGDFIGDPANAVNTLYKWGGDQFDAQMLIDILEEVCVALSIPSGQYLPNPAIASKLLDIPEPDFVEMGKELRIPVYEVADDDMGYVELGASIYPVPAKTDSAGNDLMPGLALIPYLNGSLGEVIKLGKSLELIITGDLSVGLAVEFRPNITSGVANLFDEQNANLKGEFKARVARANTDEAKMISEVPGVGHIAIQDISNELGVTVGLNEKTGFHWELDLQGCSFVISTAEGDGFLSKILPKDGIKTDFDLTVGWSSLDGLYFRGSAALEVTIPVHKSIGPIVLESVYLSINVKDDGHIYISLAVSAGAKLGPVSAAVDKVGLTAEIDFPQGGGNMGPMNMDFRFKPPNGIGLAIDAGPVAGGGYIEIDIENERYAGILQLKFGEIGLTAIGLITTRLPDGSKGFSMLVLVCVEFSPPIQLSFGFVLSGVGGLAGLNRTMMVDALRQGLKNRTLDSIMFPQDPIKNAAKIISDLRAVFPPKNGNFILGPMVMVAWGTPPLITAELGIIIELPDPIRIAILGQLTSILPLPEEALVELHMDVLGVLDFAEKTFSIDAALYDSRILTYTLSGEMAMRLNFGDNPNFALSVGGMHPQFSAPAGFPALKRLTLSLGSGNNPRLNCEAYMAITSNSTQFGARVEVYASEAGFTLTGFMSYDALFIFSPFSFVVDMGAAVSVKKGSRKLMTVRLDLTLSGPAPWRARGEATFEVMWIDVTVDFDVSFGSASAVLPPSVDPWPQLQAAFENPGNWAGVLPAGSEMAVSIKGKAGAVEDEVLVHPMGTLEVRQRVLPLDLKLDCFGNAPIKGADKYCISGVKGSGVDLDYTHTREHFARAQFQSMSDADKISLPSFEKLKAGVSIGKDSVDFTSPVLYEIEYEVEIIDEDGVATDLMQLSEYNNFLTDATMKLPVRYGSAFMGRSSAKKVPSSNVGNNKYHQYGVGPRIAVLEEGYLIVSTMDLAASVEIEENDGTLTQAEAADRLSDYIAKNPAMKNELQIVPAYEAA